MASPIAAVSRTNKHIVSNDYPLFSFHLCLVPALNAIVQYQFSGTNSFGTCTGKPINSTHVKTRKYLLRTVLYQN